MTGTKVSYGISFTFSGRGSEARPGRGPPRSRRPKVTLAPRYPLAKDSTYLAQSTVNNKVGAVDEAALITGQEENGLSLLNSLAEPTAGEMHLAAEPLGVVVAQPVL